jgi:hypothetical protein
MSTVLRTVGAMMQRKLVELTIRYVQPFAKIGQRLLGFEQRVA